MKNLSPLRLSRCTIRSRTTYHVSRISRKTSELLPLSLSLSRAADRSCESRSVIGRRYCSRNNSRFVQDGVITATRYSVNYSISCEYICVFWFSVYLSSIIFIFRYFVSPPPLILLYKRSMKHSLFYLLIIIIISAMHLPFNKYHVLPAGGY